MVFPYTQLFGLCTHAWVIPWQCNAMDSNSEQCSSLEHIVIRIECVHDCGIPTMYKPCTLWDEEP